MLEIRSREDFEEWLEDKPPSWVQILIVRTALRGLPFGLVARKGSSDYDDYCLALFRTLILAWTACNWPSRNFKEAAESAAQSIVNVVGGFISASGMPYNAAPDVAFACYAAGYPQFSAADPGDVVAAVADAAGMWNEQSRLQIWRAVSIDCKWLEDHINSKQAARVLSRKGLWLETVPYPWTQAWTSALRKLPLPDMSFSVWFDWFGRRVSGERASFLIKGDTRRVEDRKILVRLAEIDEGFWQAGAYFANTSLQRWIDEARIKVELPLENLLPDAPTQTSAVTVYAVNHNGKVDRLPTKEQQQLRDLSNQRKIYADVREAFEDLLAEGQRVGEALAIALNRILRSMPEAFEDAEAYLVWRDGNRLRRLYLAHRAVAGTTDPDPARLEPAIAEQLGGALDLFNLFAMGDEGLRAKDEATIPFQERASAETEAALARPVVAAMLDTPAIFSDDALDDLEASLGDDGLPRDDPYDAQTRIQNNKTWRNVTAAMFTAVRNVVIRASQFAGKEAARGALNAMGGTAFTDFLGATKIYEPLLEFISTNASALSAYAATAFSSYRIDVLIDAVRRYFKGG